MKMANANFSVSLFSQERSKMNKFTNLNNLSNGIGFVSPVSKERLNDNKKVLKAPPNSPINIGFQGFGNRYNSYPTGAK